MNIKIISYILLILVLASCGRHESSYVVQAQNTSSSSAVKDIPSALGDCSSGNEGVEGDHKTTCRLGTTPIKDQGNTDLCWLYAMLAAIESDRIAMGDSVNLSPMWVARQSVVEQSFDTYLSGRDISLRGTLPEAMRLIQTYGVVAWDAYHPDFNSHSLTRKVEHLAKTLSAQKTGIDRLQSSLADILDDAIGPAPRFVFMLGAEYTPVEFAHSVCLPDEWQAYTSFTHHPFGQPCVVEVPDNRQHHTAMNIPIDTLLYKVIGSLKNHHPVAWEGCMKNEELKNNAENIKYHNSSAQNTRQHLFERHILTDDHCMAIVGMTYNRNGERVFICKNSWGIDDGDHGYRYMTERQFMLSTIMVMIKQQ